jgi:hypothetical protein
LFERFVFEHTARARGAAQSLVMEDHHVTVTAKLAIQLDHIRPRSDSPLEGETRIFREISGGAPVGDFGKGSHRGIRNGYSPEKPAREIH